MTPAAFKRSIRDLQVWCSSCMVAFSGSDPIGVLIGAKRLTGTLVHRVAVHPDHVRQGHGRHLLTSLSSKLSILGPPRMVAEVPDRLVPACELFRASGYVQEAVLTDYVLEDVEHDTPQLPARFLIPLTVDDSIANGLLGVDARVCWERSIETLTARKDEIRGLAIASDEGIEACVLHTEDGEVLTLHTSVEDDGARFRLLLGRLRSAGVKTLRFAKVHPAEIAAPVLESLGFRPAGAHRLHATTARSA